VTLTLVFAAVVGATAWGAMFAFDRRGFWRRAALAGAAVGIYAVAVQPRRIGDLFATAHAWPDVGVGLLGAGLLYAAFWMGEQLLVILLPGLAREVADLYDLRGATKRRYIPLVLVVASLGEELFFRGLWQARTSFVVGLVVYAAVHVWERKLVLIAAAVLGGALWGGLLAWTGGLVAPVVSHVAWDLAIIWWKPVHPAARAQRWSDRLHSAPDPPGTPAAGGPC
jgi:membrane protease YdiL (CAAX protease family)